MSYNPKDEISNDIGEELTEILGGRITAIEIDWKGNEEEVTRAPYDAYDKGCDEIIRFFSEGDFDKVMNYIEDDKQEKFRVNKNRLIVANRKNCEMRFSLN